MCRTAHPSGPLFPFRTGRRRGVINHHMTTRFPILIALGAAGLLLLAACSPSSDSSSSDPSPAVSFNVIDQEASTASVASCSVDEASLGEIDGWPIGGSGDPEMIPIVMSSLVSAGPNRFLYNITDGNYRVLTSPDVDTMISFYALERDADTPTQTVQGAFLDTQISRLIDKLRASGRIENTLIVFTSDNGGVYRISKQWPLRAGSVSSATRTQGQLL